MDELVSSPATEKCGQKIGTALPSMDEADLTAGGAAFKDQAANALTNDQGLPLLLYELAVRLPAQPDIQALCVWLYEPVGKVTRLHVLMADLPVKLRNDMDFPVEDSVAGWVWAKQQPLMINTNAEMRFPEFARCLLEAGIESFCGVPLTIANRRIGVLGLASTKPDAFCHLKLQFMQRSPDAVSVADNPSAFEAPIGPNCERDKETFCMEEKVRPEDSFEDIIGRSASLRVVFDEVKIVAPTNSAVIILGETGTGKELIARAIHNRSSRRQMPFIKVNCAAIPSGLLESELFGHERGAFTGAIARKIGRFELANGGTLFLDEIGDIPPELQPKLLRVLQEQEFERLGSTQTTRVDVRIVAATSRDLPQMVANREFRSDLYYRLYVFPVRLPALRERPEDIALLVRHFVDLCAKRMNKQVEHVRQESMQEFLAYTWPGNVRELQNFIERSVILSPGSVLQPPLAELKRPADCQNTCGLSAGTAFVTLKDAEREHILQALAESNCVLGGPNGAAAKLGLRRTTLFHKMRRLSISRAEAGRPDLVQ
jgi:formate hydrogenlyase transcriptional activator